MYHRKIIYETFSLWLSVIHLFYPVKVTTILTMRPNYWVHIFKHISHSWIAVIAKNTLLSTEKGGRISRWGVNNGRSFYKRTLV